MDQGLRHLTGRAKSDVNILIIRCAPRHAGVVDEDVNILFLGLDGLDEVVAPSLGLDIRGVTWSSVSFSGTTATVLAYAQIGHDVLARPRARFVQLFRDLIRRGRQTGRYERP